LSAVVVCGVVALPIGAISLRTSGVYFIMITLAFAQMIYYFAVSWPAYGGEDGLSISVRNVFPGVNTAQPLLLLPDLLRTCLMAALGLFLAAARLALRRGAAGGTAERDAARPRSASRRSVSVWLMRFRRLGDGDRSWPARCSRTSAEFVSPSMLSWQMSGELIVLIILGGKGRLFGPVAGAHALRADRICARRHDGALAVFPRPDPARASSCSRAAGCWACWPERRVMAEPVLEVRRPAQNHSAR
jgi:branched-chain amino acid transport system permease protein